MIPAAQRRILAPHVHLQMLEKVVVLVGREGHQHAHRAGQAGVHQRVRAAGDERGLLQGEHRFADVKDGHALGLLAGTG